MARQKKTIERQVVDRMKALGVYKTEYRNTVNIYIDMLYQYEILSERFAEEGYQVEEEYTNKAGAVNMRKTPTLAAIEKLRMDLIAYSNALCLNPKSLGSVKADNKKKSTLAKALNKFG